MSQATTTTTPAAADVATIGRRAIEAARFATGADRAGRRFVNIGLFVAEAIEGAKPGNTVRVLYHSINSALGTKRGANSANPAVVWRTGIEQARQYAPDCFVHVGAVAYDATGLTVTVA